MFPCYKVSYLKITSSRVLVDPIGPFDFLGTNSLRRLECENIGYIFDCPIAWGSLTHLMASNLKFSLADNNALFRLLRRCTHLEACALEFEKQRLHPAIVIGVDHNPFSLPRLRHFSIKHPLYYPGGGAHFLDNLALSGLRSFSCEFLAGSLPADPLRFLFPLFIDRLECLKVNVKLFPSEVLLAALAIMPVLEELHIVGEPVTPERRRDPLFFTQLVPELCPRLQRVELSDFKALSDATILEFILSRSQLQNVVRLARFSCRLQRDMQRDVLPALESTGCVVDLKYDSVPPAYSLFEWAPTHVEH
ncbi:F-box domain-containing protein [Mycena sanguinolenta]|uniref:F-box domain-containing protein n=1 Tax=Mycena sanguinolenta TaxID=230812 RepID=A0A8H7CQE4_9AGAR|nr:F-box domain-containing protein [Mycena sanguinolenta]